MYCLNEQQIDYIFNDIRARGVEMEDLQLNLLDHVCCIIEHDLKDDGDFESFYQKTIKQFYKKELKEIEDETINLLTFKNYYAMKKTMITSGIITAVLFTFGSFFKIMHWPGAGFLLLLACAFSVIFLPLFFLFKSKEAASNSDKIVLAVGTLTGILFMLHATFKVFHWPGAAPLLFAMLISLTFIFIPLYFFNGIKKPEQKTNTVAVTLILIVLSGVLFLQTNVRASYNVEVVKTQNYLEEDKLVSRFQDIKKDTTTKQGDLEDVAKQITKLATDLKTIIVSNEIGSNTIPSNFMEEGIVLRENILGDSFEMNNVHGKKLIELSALLKKYNALCENPKLKISETNLIYSLKNETTHRYQNLSVLSSLNQILIWVA